MVITKLKWGLLYKWIPILKWGSPMPISVKQGFISLWIPISKWESPFWNGHIQFTISKQWSPFQNRDSLVCESPFWNGDHRFEMCYRQVILNLHALRSNIITDVLSFSHLRTRLDSGPTQNEQSEAPRLHWMGGQERLLEILAREGASKVPNAYAKNRKSVLNGGKEESLHKFWGFGLSDAWLNAFREPCQHKGPILKWGLPILNRAGRQIHFKMGSPHLKKLAVNRGLTYIWYGWGIQFARLWSLNHDLTTSLGLRHALNSLTTISVSVRKKLYFQVGR